MRTLEIIVGILVLWFLAGVPLSMLIGAGLRRARLRREALGERVVEREPRGPYHERID